MDRRFFIGFYMAEKHGGWWVYGFQSGSGPADSEDETVGF